MGFRLRSWAPGTNYRAVNVARLPTTATGDASGYAVGAGLKVNLPMLGKGDNIIGQFTYAKGAIAVRRFGWCAWLRRRPAATARPVIMARSLMPSLRRATTLDQTTGWSVIGGFEHNWNPGWKSSLYGSYGKVEYSALASAQIIPAAALAGSSANCRYWQVGSRTVWTPVANLDLSVDVMYNNLDTAFATGATTYADKTWWSGMFRAQRNFCP